jgi:hypothetical protein
MYKLLRILQPFKLTAHRPRKSAYTMGKAATILAFHSLKPTKRKASSPCLVQRLDMWRLTESGIWPVVSPSSPNSLLSSNHGAKWRDSINCPASKLVPKGGRSNSALQPLFDFLWTRIYGLCFWLTCCPSPVYLKFILCSIVSTLPFHYLPLIPPLSLIADFLQPISKCSSLLPSLPLSALRLRPFRSVLLTRRSYS